MTEKNKTECETCGTKKDQEPAYQPLRNPPNWPSKAEGRSSGKKRDNNPPKKDGKCS